MSDTEDTIQEQGIAPASVIASGLSVLASDALNGFGPDSRLYRRLAAVGLEPAEAAAEVQALVRHIRARALQLARRPVQAEV